MNKLIKALLGLSCVLAQPLMADVNTMEDVIVTAIHSPQEAADLPLNWAAIDDSDLNMVEHIHINESFQRIAGGWISRGNGQESLTALRSPVLTGAGSCGAFFVAQDGLSLRAPGFCNVNQLFDANTEQAQRIEVLKGPATALYGSGAMHGVINTLSIDPATGDQHEIGLEGGPHGYLRAKYKAASTRAEHGFAMAVNVATDDGYKDDSGYDQQKGTFRHRFDGDTWDTDTILALTNLDQDTSGFIQGYKAYEDEDRKKENPNPDAYRDAKSVHLQSNISREIGEGSRLTFTPYWRDNEMEFLQHFLPWQSVEENGHQSFGFNTKWYLEKEWFQLTSGIDLEYTDGWLKEEQDEPFSPNQPAGTHYDYDVEASMASIWSQLNWDASDRLNVSAGLRYEYTNYDYTNNTDDGPACSPSATACRFYRPGDREDDFSNWSINVGGLYDLNDAHAVYLRASRGFRAPQTTELYRLQAGQEVADLDSEGLNSIDLGFRGIVGEFHYEIGSYYMEKEDVIFQDSNRQNVSGASTLHYGIDVSLRWNLPANFDLAMDANVARHEYDSDIELIGSSGDIKGNDIDTAPRRFGSLRLGWQIRPQHRAELEWVHMDKYYLEPDNNHEYDGHNLLNLRLTSQITEKFMVALRATNLTDEDYAERADFGFGNYRYFVGEPRSLYVQLSYQLPR
jgi:iron complex outermembrane recepter protein